MAWTLKRASTIRTWTKHTPPFLTHGHRDKERKRKEWWSYLMAEGRKGCIHRRGRKRGRGGRELLSEGSKRGRKGEKCAGFALGRAKDGPGILYIGPED